MMDPGSEAFREMVEQASDTVLLLDTKGAVVYANAATETLFGRPPRDLLGEAFGRVVGAEQPTEIQIRHPRRGAVTADIRTARVSLEGKAYDVVYLRDVTERKRTEEQLRERVKEQTCISRVAELLLPTNAPLDETLQAVVDVLPAAWQHSDVAAARITLGSREYASEGFRETPWRQVQPIAGGSMGDGVVEVGYLEEHPEADEGPFLAEERELLRLVAIKLGEALERRHSEAALRRTNRARHVLSAGNTELLRAEDEGALLAAICRICVKAGGYRMAWAGYAEQNAAKTVRPAAQAGFEDGYLDSISITWADEPRGRGPAGRAIRTGMSQVSRDFATDSKVAPWRDEALQRGYQSAIALPLKDSSETFGVLSIYAAEPDAFDSEEIRLLNELSSDLAFGIVTLRARAEYELAKDRITHLAYFDELTALPNRNRLMEALAQAAGKLGAGQQCALVTLNVARFGEIQAGIGVVQADELLRQIADRIRGALHESELPARVGGDEFAVLLSEGGGDRARECTQRIEQAMVPPFQQGGIPISVQLRAGAAVAPDHGLSPEVLLLRSAIAVRQAKRTGTIFELYGGPTESETRHRLALITELRAAIEADQFELHYQPQVDLVAGKVTAVEALVRWRHPVRGLLPPGEFIGIAEQTGLINPLTYLVLNAALRQCSLWGKQGFYIPVAINISVNNFNDVDFDTHVEDMLRTWHVSPKLLQLEITESVLMQEPKKAHDLLVRLTTKGINISIDDFGTGFSSLSYVASLPIDALKIDRSFVIRMLESPRTRGVVAATISLARSLGIRVVAEGVDAREQADALMEMGCTEFQGFLFSPPVNADALRRWTAGFSLESYA
ncbi:MAG: EAL domain-containing protein [Gammaproteobacteria bacterium]|nr:EAL domain-containing protein [Gammaproteobacteria bacterium]